MTENNQHPLYEHESLDGAIVIFDSGLGGISVYHEVKKLLPYHHYIYAFDNAGFPYGEKSGSFIIERIEKIIAAILVQHPITLLIIACNSASTLSLPSLRARFKFPVVGVVPAIKPAVQLTKNGLVGLLATRGTVQRQYTRDLITQFAKSCKFTLLGSAELVDIAERKLRGESVDIKTLQYIMEPWLKLPQPPDTIVLGCTHFPLIREELLAVLPQGTQLIDSGNAIARRTAWLLENRTCDEKEPIKPSATVLNNLAFCTAFNTYTVVYKNLMEQFGLGKLEKLQI